MVQLPNNCRVGKFSVYPKNWDKTKASVKIKWRVTYRFYDDNLKQNKQIKFESINGFYNLKDRQLATKNWIDAELYELQENNYNPILEKYTEKEAQKITDVDEDTPFIVALEFALSKDSTSEKNANENKRYLDHIIRAIKECMLEKLNIGQVRLKHLYLIFDRLQQNEKNWSDNMYNCHRKTLGKLFTFLCKYEAVLTNFPLKMERKQILTKRRRILTDVECVSVYNFLKSNYYNFWRFQQIFFQSGCRMAELMRLEADDVDLVKKEFWVVVYKGGRPRRERRAITKLALPLWSEILQMAVNGNDILFSKFLVPGDVKISPKQVTRRWYQHIKGHKKTGPKLDIKIDADFYAMKHLYLDRLAAIAGDEAAQKAAGHTNMRITKSHYLVNAEDRRLAERKLQAVEFVALG